MQHDTAMYKLQIIWNNETGTICLYWNHCWWTCKLKNNIATLNLNLQIPELSAPEMMGTPTQVATFQTCHTLKCLREKLNCRQGVGGIWNWFAAFNATTVFPTNQVPHKNDQNDPPARVIFDLNGTAKLSIRVFLPINAQKSLKNMFSHPPVFSWEVPKDLIIRTQTAKNQLHASGLVKIEMCGMRLWTHRICRFSESEVGNV